MRILYITDNGFCNRNGRFYYDSANFTHISYLKKYFDEFVYVARKGEFDNSFIEIASNETVYLVNKFAFQTLYRTLYREIKNVDVVICYGINGYLAEFIAKMQHKIIVAYIGGNAAKTFFVRKTISGFLASPFFYLLDKYKCWNADYMHYCAKHLQKLFPSQGKILICSGVNITIDETCIEKRKKKIFSNNSSFLKIGLIGYTYHRIKGIDTAIKAISLVAKERAVELQIVGRGEHSKLDKLSKKLNIDSKVKFLGTKKNGQELYEWLDTLDVYIQPSRTEGLPRATVEAMSRACPIVASDVGGIPELIDERFLIKPNDYVSLSKKILELANNSELRLQQGKQNFNHAQAYTNANREAKYREFYEDIKKNF